MTTFTNQSKFSGQTPIAYNSTKTYNEVGYLYNGIVGTLWTNNTKN